MRKNLILDNFLIIISVVVVLLSFLIGTELRNNWEPDYNLRHLTIVNNEAVLHSEMTRDSINNILQSERMLKSDLGNANVFCGIGVTYFEGAMDWDSIALGKSSPDKRHSFLVMGGYRLAPHSAFFLKDDKFFAKSAYSRLDTTGLTNITYGTRELPVRYAGAFDQDLPGYVMLPIRDSVYKAVRFLTPVFGMLILLLGLYYVIVRPLETMVSVGNGDVFGETNTRNLRVAGWWLIGLALMPGFILVILYLFIAKKVSPEIHFAFPEIFFENQALLIAGIILLLIARAFAKGHGLLKSNSSFV